MVGAAGGQDGQAALVGLEVEPGSKYRVGIEKESGSTRAGKNRCVEVMEAWASAGRATGRA